MNTPGRFVHGGDLQRLAAERRLDPRDLIDFSSSINPLGPPPVVQQVLANALELVKVYPDSNSRALRHKLAQAWSVPEASVLVGNGTTELIFLIARAMKSHTVAIFGPTFSEYERAAKMAGAHVEHLLSTAETNFSWNLTDHAKRVLAQSPLCFLCNPNNPTGAVISREQSLRLVESFPQTLFVVDEAFLDFLPDPGEVSMLPYTKTHSNLLVLRSFTKFYSIPGLRLGMVVGDPRRIRFLEAYKEPWTVNGIALAIGERLVEEKAFGASTRAWLPLQRASLVAALKEMVGLTPIPSEANFVLVKIDRCGIHAPWLQECLLREKIVIRDASNFEGLDPSYMRLAVKNSLQNEILVTALRQLLASSHELSTLGQ
jgi:threonine-phosphate decarboxylase